VNGVEEILGQEDGTIENIRQWKADAHRQRKGNLLGEVEESLLAKNGRS
jgi:hypothetical protein